MQICTIKIEHYVHYVHYITSFFSIFTSYIVTWNEADPCIPFF